MSVLFESNQNSLKKLFTTHSKDDCLKFTDLLKLCSSTRIFPDLLSSPDLHKVLVEVAQDPNTFSISQNLNYSQFVVFLHSVASKAFFDKAESEQESLLFQHLKKSCGLRYSVDFEVKPAETKSNKRVPKLNIESAHNLKPAPKSTGQISLKPNSTKNAKSSSFLFRNSPEKLTAGRLNKVHAYSIVTMPRNTDKSSKPSPRPLLTERNLKRGLTSISSCNTLSASKLPNRLGKLLQILEKFKSTKTLDPSQIKCHRFLSIISKILRRAEITQLQLRLSLKLWSVIARRLRSDFNA